MSNGPDRHADTVISQHIELVNVIDRLAGHHRMNATGVIANHAAERVSAMSRRIGAERESVFCRCVSQLIEHDARLYARISLLWIQLYDVVHVLREVEHDGYVDRLAGDTGASASGNNRRAMAPAHRRSLDHVASIGGEHNTDRRHPVVAGVGGVHGAVSGAEPNLAFDRR